MKCLCWILIIVTISLAAANEHKEVWQDALCKLNEELLEDVEKCFELEGKEIQVAVKECFASLSSTDDMKQFTKEACEDKTLFDKLDECVEGKGFTDEKEHKPDEAIACYGELFKKHGLSELEDYFLRK